VALNSRRLRGRGKEKDVRRSCKESSSREGKGPLSDSASGREGKTELDEREEKEVSNRTPTGSKNLHIVRSVRVAISSLDSRIAATEDERGEEDELRGNAENSCHRPKKVLWGKRMNFS